MNIKKEATVGRRATLFLGLGLIILWLFAIRLPGATGGVEGLGPSAVAIGWITWLDAAAAVAAFIMFVAGNRSVTSRIHPGWPAIQALFLGTFGIMGVTAAVPAWLSGWNFFFAAAFALLAVAEGREVVRGASSEKTLSHFGGRFGPSIGYTPANEALGGEEKDPRESLPPETPEKRSA